MADAGTAAPAPVYALSLRQPWAWLVVHGGKRIENRTWLRMNFPRGRILLHAAKGMTRAEYEGVVVFAHQADPSVVVPPAAELRRGGFVGRCRIVGVRSYAQRLALGRYHPWAMEGQFGYDLADVAPVPFVASRGELGFYRAPDEALAALRLAGMPALG